MNYKSFMSSPDRDCAIIAHRGIWRDAPENSLPAIERAIDEGYDIVEIDVRRSRDGVFYLVHDDSLARMTGVDAAVQDLTSAELATLSLRNRSGDMENAFTANCLASLEQVFELTRGRILIHLDVKERDLIPDVIAFTQSMGMIDEVDVWSELRNDGDLARINASIMSQNVAFIAKTRLNVPDAALRTELVLKLKPLICEIYFDRTDDVAALKSRFAAAGVTLWVNTLDDVSCAGFTDTAALKDPDAVWGRLLDAGVSAIQTDEAAALKAYLATRR